MYRSSVISKLRHARLFSATLVAGAVCLAFVPTAHAQEVEPLYKNLDECFYFGHPHGRTIGHVPYGDVRIISQVLKHPRAGYGPRPVEVSAVIIPGIPVGTRRKPTPQPSAGFHTGGENDVDSGHVIALHLGGPDVPLNIVPQWAHWQRLGEWRAMERSLDAQAKHIADQSRHPAGGLPTRSILMWVQIHYKNTGNITPSITTWSFPKEFFVSACVVELAHYNDCIPGLPPILNNQKFEGGPPH